MSTLRKTLRRTFMAALASACGIGAAAAEEISVTHWGALMYGTPYAVAMEKGFFRQAGVEITGILTSKGGGTTVRNVLAGGLPYGEVALSAAIAALREGVDIKIVNSAVHTVADLLWVTMPNSEVRTIKDLAGKKMAITSPKSVTDMLSIMALDAAGIALKDVERPALGGIGAGLAALETGAVHAAAILDPIWSARQNRYRVLFYVKDVLPPMTQVVGIATTEFTRTHPQKVRAIIAGRRAGVDFVYANPKESAAILAKEYNLAPAVAEIAVTNMAALNYWSRGNFDLTGMNEMIRGLRIIGDVTGEVDWNKIIDRSFLPEDLRGSS
ncbi:MAG: ABC transporter substrate-binding protein [Pseudomonadota bacterium]